MFYSSTKPRIIALICIQLLLLSFGACSSAPQTTNRTLKLESYFFGPDPRELSGGTLSPQGKLLAVADKPEDTTVFELLPNPKSNSMAYGDYLNLHTVSGFSNYVKKVNNWIDFEGVDMCPENNSIYIINEGTRDLLIIKNNSLEIQTFEKLKPELWLGGGNAGWEGVAVDCKRQVAYLAKERDPRFLVQLDLKTKIYRRMPDLATSPRVGQTQPHPLYPHTTMWWGPDYSDLAFEEHNGRPFLYLLERGTFEVVKVDIQKWAVVERYSFFEELLENSLHLAQVYDTQERFGLAELLILSPKHIYIGLDNNRKPLSELARRTLKLDPSSAPNAGLLLKYRRPGGF